ncbi:MAG: hypothetical protein ABIJ11_00240 [Elusimicrobiota bacterium]
MVKTEDIVDIIEETIRKGRWKSAVSAGDEPPKKHYRGFYMEERFIKSWTALPKGRPFISEYQVRDLIKDGAKEIRVPGNAIISPLAQDTIQEKGIRVVFE